MWRIWQFAVGCVLLDIFAKVHQKMRLVSWKDEFQVSSSGTLAGDSSAPVLRQFWMERHHSIVHNDVRDAVVEFPELQFQAAAAFGTSSFPSDNLEVAKVQSDKNVQLFHQRSRKCSDAGGQGRLACCNGTGCWNQG